MEEDVKVLINADVREVFEEIIAKLDKLVIIVRNLVDMVPVMPIMYAFVILDGLANYAIKVNHCLSLLFTRCLNKCIMLCSKVLSRQSIDDGFLFSGKSNLNPNEEISFYSDEEDDEFVAPPHQKKKHKIFV